MRPFRWPPPPAIEPPPRARLIEPHRWRHAKALPPVLPNVEQHVRQRAPHLPRRPQYPQVVAVGEDPASPREDAIHAAREARGDRLHPAREIPRARRLDEQMEMIDLHRVVHEPESPALA